MTLASDFASKRADIQLAARKAAVAEFGDLDWEKDGHDQNTHFEFKFGNEWGTANVPELYFYVERYDGNSGIELMVWADTGWFSDDALETDYPSPGDADGTNLEDFCEAVREAVADELGKENEPVWEFSSRAGSSLVFTATFALRDGDVSGMDGYMCRECGNVESFQRRLEIEEPFERNEKTGDWAGDHSQEELLDVIEVTCADCNAVVY